MAMDDHDTISGIRRPVEFTIDGHTYQTLVRWQPAEHLLLLAGRDPDDYHLGELRRYCVRPVHYANDQIVGIHRRARFVAFRHCLDACDAR
jgi:hypothetical protein